MKAVILAGGLGTRLLPYTKTLPKPMLPLGKKPILEYVINWIKKMVLETLFYVLVTNMKKLNHILRMARNLMLMLNMQYQKNLLLLLDS